MIIRFFSKYCRKHSLNCLFVTIAMAASALSAVAAADDTILDDWSNQSAYRPAPIIFCHGFSSGSPHKWSEMTGIGFSDVTKELVDAEFQNRLKKYFDPYFDIGAVLTDSFTEPSLDGLDHSPYSVSYLERMAFNDPNGSIDSYPCNVTGTPDHHGDTRGWADRLYDAVEDVFEKYNSDQPSEQKESKVKLICHSMGGLAAREMLTNDTKYPESQNRIDTVVTISSPHLGSGFAMLSYWLPGIQYKGGIGGNLLKAVGVGIHKLNRDGEILFAGPASIDMKPGSDFLKTLNERAKPIDVRAFCIYSEKHHMGNLFLGGRGDGVVTTPSQKANGSEWIFDEYYRQVSTHGPAPQKTDTPDPPLDANDPGYEPGAFVAVMKWLDDKAPAVIITEPELDENRDFIGKENGTLTVRGIVLNEYFPAHCLLTLEYRESGELEWIEFEPEKEKKLKPSSLWQNWRHGTVPEKISNVVETWQAANEGQNAEIVAEFEEQLTGLDPEKKYQVRVTVVNATGLMDMDTVADGKFILIVDGQTIACTVNLDTKKKFLTDFKWPPGKNRPLRHPGPEFQCTPLRHPQSRFRPILSLPPNTLILGRIPF